MKTQLNIERSALLIELGMPKHKASATELYKDPISQWTGKGCPVFTLDDLLRELPKYLDYEFEGEKYAADFTFHWSNRFLHYEAGYDLYDMWDKSHYCAPELIDALYYLTVWCLKNGYLKYE